MWQKTQNNSLTSHDKSNNRDLFSKKNTDTSRQHFFITFYLFNMRKQNINYDINYKNS